MPNPENTAALAEIAYWLHDLMAWVGFGTVVGVAGKAILPGRHPGLWAMLGVGIGGTVAGCATLSFLSGGAYYTPISPVGFVASTIGAFVMLLFYKLAFGAWLFDQHDVDLRNAPAAPLFNAFSPPARRRRTTSHYYSAIDDDVTP